ncbi:MULTISPECIES: ABC transporter permease [unclassified Granulicatella]|uniref:ABC transporter permease n=1 Tax=unclassified Granulicatella TaxID=2630493 RepID=UPI0010736AAF|nr:MULTISPECIES: ABC transporter permease [unclassified Granulicatella]MBF0780938.1 ABC transporter permease [Granulicatella sp. 19428wC4_WM01]TFU93000.1 ABC transporter permease [Granulicatella sp. WM01]
MTIIISAIMQGILWSLLSLGLFITFRILSFADMTTEGTFPLGGAVCAVLIYQGVHPILATVIAMCSGIMAGLLTGFLMTVCKIPSLLSGILTMTALLSINLRIMGRANMTLLNKPTIFTSVSFLNLPEYFDGILVGFILIGLLIGLMLFFFSTELGQALIATGDNKKMAKSLGISTNKMTIFGLMIANAIIALSGAVLAQSNGFIDVNSGIGTIVIALAAIIIAEVLFAKVSFGERLISIVVGAIVYRLLLVFVLSLNIFEANDFKMMSACIIAIFLTLPHVTLKSKKGV